MPLRQPIFPRFAQSGPPSRTALSDRPPGPLSGVRASEHEDRDHPVRLLLILGIVRVRLHGPLPPEFALVARGLVRDVVVLLGPVLELDVRLFAYVVDP